MGISRECEQRQPLLTGVKQSKGAGLFPHQLMNSAPSKPQSCRTRVSTAPGRRRVSIRQKEARELGAQAATLSDSTELAERRTKRTCSPIGLSAKRMRLVEREEEEEEKEGTSFMGTQTKYDERLENESRAIEPELQVTSSYSSSSGRSSGMSSGRTSRTAIEDDMENDGYVEVDDIEEEDDEEMKVDKTDIITSDEDEEQHRLLDGPTDMESRLLRFRKLSVDLGRRFNMFPLNAPTPLTKRCRGMGEASEVWTVLCHKDEMHSICNEQFMVPHKLSRPRKPTDPYFLEPRAILIDWMQDVCWTEKLQRETFHLAIDYVDRVLAKGPAVEMYVEMHQFQLLGTTALFIASKYEEIYPPKVEDLVSYTAGACTIEQVRRLEMIILKTLEWELHVITPLHWTHLFLELLTGNPKPSTSSSGVSLLPQSTDGYFCEEDTSELPVTTSSCARDDFMHLAYLMDVVILHATSRKYSNRTLAAALMYAVYDADRAIEQVTGLSLEDKTVREAVEWIQPIVMFCDEHKVPVLKLPVIEGVRPDVIHTIQVLRASVMVHTMKHLEVVMEEIEMVRNQLDKEREEREILQRSAAIRLPPTPPSLT